MKRAEQRKATALEVCKTILENRHLFSEQNVKTAQYQIDRMDVLKDRYTLNKAQWNWIKLLNKEIQKKGIGEEEAKQQGANPAGSGPEEIALRAG